MQFHSILCNQWQNRIKSHCGTPSSQTKSLTGRFWFENGGSRLTFLVWPLTNFFYSFKMSYLFLVYVQSLSIKWKKNTFKRLHIFSQSTIKALTTWTMQFFVTVKASVDDKGERKKANGSVFFFFLCCCRFVFQMQQAKAMWQVCVATLRISLEAPDRIQSKEKTLRVSLRTTSRHGRQLTIASLLTHRRRGLWSDTLYHHKNLWAQCQL